MVRMVRADNVMHLKQALQIDAGLILALLRYGSEVIAWLTNRPMKSSSQTAGIQLSSKPHYLNFERVSFSLLKPADWISITSNCFGQ